MIWRPLIISSHLVQNKVCTFMVKQRMVKLNQQFFLLEYSFVFAI